MRVKNKRVENTKEVQEKYSLATNQEPPTKEELPATFKGSRKRRFWQYIDNIGLIVILTAVFFALDAGVDLLYQNGVADTQSSAQQFTVQDLEGVLLSLIITGIVLASIKLMLEIGYDSIHWFLETESDTSWSSFKAFRKMTPFQQWLIFILLFYVASQIFTGVLRALA